MYIASDLISKAWNLSGIVAKDLQKPSGSQMTNGLFLLNEILEFSASDLHIIPYWTRATLTMLQNVELYYVPNLYAVELLTFNIGPVRYSMEEQSRYQYFATGRVDNLSTLPSQFHVERVKGGSNIYIYPIPQQTYASNYSGKFGLTDITLTTNMLTVYDSFYCTYLRYALASYMCDDYNIEMPPGTAKKLQEIILKLTDTSPPDLSMQKLSSFRGDDFINYGDVNIGHGHRPQ